MDHITCCMQHIVAVTGSNMQMDKIVDELLEADVVRQPAEACAGVTNSTVPLEPTQKHC